MTDQSQVKRTIASLKVQSEKYAKLAFAQSSQEDSAKYYDISEVLSRAANHIEHINNRIK